MGREIGTSINESEKQVEEHCIPFSLALTKSEKSACDDWTMWSIVSTDRSGLLESSESTIRLTREARDDACASSSCMPCEKSM